MEPRPRRGLNAHALVHLVCRGSRCVGVVPLTLNYCSVEQLSPIANVYERAEMRKLLRITKKVCAAPSSYTSDFSSIGIHIIYIWGVLRGIFYYIPPHIPILKYIYLNVLWSQPVAGILASNLPHAL